MSANEKATKWPELLFGVVGVGLFLSLGGTWLTMASSHWEFRTAQILFASFGLVCVVTYFLWRRSQTRVTRSQQILGILLTALGIIIALVLCLSVVPYRENVFLLAQNPSPLLPDDRPDPDLNPFNSLPSLPHLLPPQYPRLCKGTVNVVFGGNVFGNVEFPFIAVEFMRHPIIIIDRENSGGLLFTFDVFDRDGKILARVVKNDVTIYPIHAFLHPRRSLHSIVIEDERGRIALNIDYVNPRIVLINARLYLPGDVLVAILPWQIGLTHLAPGEDRALGGRTISGDTYCGSGHTGFQLQIPN